MPEIAPRRIPTHQATAPVVIENAKGGSANDHITGNEVGNILTGNLGNDTVAGLGGDDTFVFNFDVGTQIQWFREGDSPAAQATQTAWDVYAAQLDGWHDALVTQYGLDLDTTDTLIVVGAGKNAGITFRYDNSFTLATSVHGDGSDLLTDFGQGNDHLQFNGMSEAEFVQLHASGLLSVTTDNTDTVISWGDGSITLAGQTLTFDSLLNGDYILFG